MRTWGKVPTDLKMLEILTDFKYLRGKTLVVKAGFSNMRRGYERLECMKEMGFLESVEYREIKRFGPGSRKKIPKKVAHIFYMTAAGIKAYKGVIGETIDGTERSYHLDPENTEKLRTIYRKSLLIEAFPGINFTSGGSWMQGEGLSNYSMADAVYDSKVIYFERKSGEVHRNKIKTQADKLFTNNGVTEVIILSPAHATRNSLSRWLKENYGGKERVLAEKEHIGIKAVLDGSVVHLACEILKSRDYSVVKQPMRNLNNGCEYLVNDIPADIYDLVGTPIYALRKIIKNQPGYGYYVVSGPSEATFIKKHYPQLLTKGECLALNNPEEAANKDEYEEDPFANED